MDEIELKTVKELDAFDEPTDEVDILINGGDLRNLVREVELPFAAEEGSPHLAGGYTGLPPEAVFLPSRRLLGEPSERYDDDEERISLLGCGCGVVGCWPLMARISLDADTVTWSDFAQPHRSEDMLFVMGKRGLVVWRYEGFGPFVFERDKYVAELGKFEASPTSFGEPRI